VAERSSRASAPRPRCSGRSYANIATGFIVSVFEADSKEKLEEQMEVLGFPIDETHEVTLPRRARVGADGQTTQQMT